MQSYHGGEPIPKVSAPDEVRQSVREEIAALGRSQSPLPCAKSPHPFRNSNLPEWIKVKHGRRSL
jgi:hypothetical protein